MQETEDLKTKVLAGIMEFRKKYPSFDEALSRYTAQYGESSVKVSEPFKISETIDPVIIILGRTTPLFYHDSKRTLTGSQGTVSIERGHVYVLGRREPPDSKLIVWSSKEESEVEHYDSRVRIIPSRIHAAILALDSSEVLFTDLGSSSGSILAGESTKPEPFIALYSAASVEVHRVTIPSKYSGKGRNGV